MFFCRNHYLYTVISMKNDFRTIYNPDMERTDVA